jgi:hypothetical protein
MRGKRWGKVIKWYKSNWDPFFPRGFFSFSGQKSAGGPHTYMYIQQHSTAQHSKMIISVREPEQIFFFVQCIVEWQLEEAPLP